MTIDAPATHVSARGTILGQGLGAKARHWPVVLIVAAFLLLGTLYNLNTPVFETPDEPWHFRYVRELATGKGLPPLSVSHDEWEQGEAHQPPLFYALGALLTRWVPIGADAQLYDRNPYAALGMPSSDGNKNAVLHEAASSHPFKDVALAVHILRWFNVLCSAVTVWTSYRIALLVLPRRRDLASGVAAIMAFNPQFLFISAGVNNDALVTCLTTLLLFLALCVCVGQAHWTRTPVVLGAIAGLAALAKLSGLTVAILVPCAYLLRLSEQPHKSWVDGFLRPTLVAGAVMLSICGWWYVRNAVLYHDPFGMGAVRAAFSVRATPLDVESLTRILFGSFISYWGVFGWMNILADEVFYTFVRILAAICAIGLVLFVARLYWRRINVAGRWQPIAMLALWVTISLVSLLQWTQLITGPQGRLLFPASAAIACFMVAGLGAWLPLRYADVLVVLVVGVLVFAATIAPYRYIRPAYELPQRIALEALPPDTRDLDIAFGDELFLLGYQIREERVPVGGTLHVRLYWLCRRLVRRNYTFYLHVFGRGGERLAGIDTYPGRGNYPTRLWLPGEVVVEEYALPITRQAVAPVAAVLRAGVYGAYSTDSLPASDGQGRSISSSPQIARVPVMPTQSVVFEPQQTLEASFEHKLMFVGYDAGLKTLSAGSDWEVTLYWKAQSRMLKDYTVFLHLLNSDNQKVAQIDEQPLAGDYPTRFWQIGESVRDPHVLRLPNDLPSGTYTLNLGLYWLDTGERLALVDRSPGATYVTLCAVRIQGQ